MKAEATVMMSNVNGTFMLAKKTMKKRKNRDRKYDKFLYLKQERNIFREWKSYCFCTNTVILFNPIF